MKNLLRLVPLLALLPLAAQDVHLRVLPRVKQPDPGRIGINLGHTGYAPWTLPSANLWMRGAGLNGTIVRLKLDVGGTASERRKGLTLDTGPSHIAQSLGLGYFDAFRTGFWDGADYIAYRFDPGAPAARIVREGKITRFINPGRASDSSAPVQRIEFDAPGEPLREGDELVLTTIKHTWNPDEFRVGENGTGFDWDRTPLHPGTALSYDTATHAPLPGSDSSLRIDAANGFELAQNYLGNQRDYWIRLPPGKTFTFSVWMKHEGPGEGRVSVDVARIASHEFQVDSTWREHRFSFPAAHPEGALRQLVLTGSPGGTYWLDAIQLHSNDAEPGALLPEALDALKAFRPGTLRIWALQTNSTHGETLDNALLPPATRRMQFVRNRGGATPGASSLPQELATAASVGANPWIIVNVSFNPREWANLIEFLAGPVSTPYGRKRAEAGHPQPYTEVFDHIYLELGNEVWSRIFAPWNWNNQPEKAAQYARLMWDSARTSPHFDPAKFSFTGPGWAGNVASRAEQSYGNRFAKTNPLSAFHAVAHYAGGFDGVSLAESGERAEQVFNRLFHVPRIQGPVMDKHAAADAATRPGLRPAAYEAGPGYALPGPGEAFTEEQETIGKSLASAITTLDAYLHAQSIGYGPLCHFVFENRGINWSTHNPDWTPHLPTLAIQMRNQHVRGDLLHTESLRMTTLDIPAATVASGGHGTRRRETKIPAAPNTPTVAAHAFRDGKDWSLVLLSREPAASRTVQVDLPFTPRSAYTRVSLTHPDPLVSNRQGLAVAPREEALQGATPSMTLTLPPHSIVILKLSE